MQALETAPLLLRPRKPDNTAAARLGHTRLPHRDGTYNATYVLDAIDTAAVLEGIMLFFSDEPVERPLRVRGTGLPYDATSTSRRCSRTRVSTRTTACSLAAEVPIVVQHARIDGDNRIIATTMAWGR